ncbi:MAG: metalloregulator ArsR/SmtB family transcription factor [Parvularculaceae bacterium]
MAAAQHVYEAISHPIRRKIIEILPVNGAPVHKIVGAFGVSQQAISKHLRILSEAGLTRSERRGQENIYFLVAGPLREMRAWLDGFWAKKLDGLKTIAEEETA